jgi:ABC-type antimicrobial peptide transport system permease subunit
VDALTLAATPAVVLVITVAACAIPAVRAARVDPIVSLSHE